MAPGLADRFCNGRVFKTTEFHLVDGWSVHGLFQQLRHRSTQLLGVMHRKQRWETKDLGSLKQRGDIFAQHFWFHTEIQHHLLNVHQNQQAVVTLQELQV